MVVPTSRSPAPSLTTTSPLRRVARGGWARGLRSGHAQAYATLAGPPDLVVACPPEPSLGEEKGMKTRLSVKGDS